MNFLVFITLNLLTANFLMAESNPQTGIASGVYREKRVAPHKKKTLFIFERNNVEQTENEYYALLLQQGKVSHAKVIPSEQGEGRFEIHPLNSIGLYSGQQLEPAAIITTIKNGKKLVVNGTSIFASENNYKFKRCDDTRVDLVDDSFMGSYRQRTRRDVVSVTPANGEPDGLFIRLPRGEFILIPIQDGLYRAHKYTSLDGRAVTDKSQIHFFVRFALEDKSANRRRLYVLSSGDMSTEAKYTHQRVQ